MAPLLTLLLVAGAMAGRMDLVKHWKMVDFEFETEEAKKWALDTGSLIPENNLPLGLDVWKDKLFITVPRWKKGVPATLNYVSVQGDASPLLKPYPSWELNNVTGLTTESNDTRVVNTFRIRVDTCDRLWAVDCGLDDIWGEGKQLAVPKLIIFDLKTDKVLKSYNIDSSHIKDSSFFANLVVESDDCDDSYAYLPDLGSYGLLVYSLKQDDAWRVDHYYFHFDPLWGDYNIAGVNFQWKDGVFGVSLKGNATDKTLFFHPLSSLNEFSVPTSVLKNKTAVADESAYHMFKKIGSRAEKWQSTSSALDSDSGVMFYTLVQKNAVGCWNSNKPYSAETNDLVESDNVTMVFPNDLVLDKEHKVWVLTDRLPVFLYRKLDTNDTNFRIFSAPVQQAINGTACQA